MDTIAEINQLKEEVAHLRSLVVEMRRLFNVETVEGRPDQKIMSLRCWSLTLVNPKNPNQTQGMLCGSEDGPCFTLSGEDEHTRLSIEVEQNEGAIRIYGEGLKRIVDIGKDGSSNPHVAVLYDDKPRAGIKATAEMGIVSAVHDDGLVRAVITGHETHGEMMVVGGDMKTAVKLSANGHDGGGFLTVNHPSGQAALILSSTDFGGGIISNTNHGEILAAWPSRKSGEDGEGE